MVTSEDFGKGVAWFQGVGADWRMIFEVSDTSEKYAEIRGKHYYCQAQSSPSQAGLRLLYYHYSCRPPTSGLARNSFKTDFWNTKKAEIWYGTFIQPK